MDLTPLTVQTLIEWSREEAPNEACGILSQDTLRLMRNDSPFPEQSFICAGLGKRIIHGEFLNDILPRYAIWHSHPKSRAVPTPPDIELMQVTMVPLIIVSLLTTVPEIAIFALDEHNPDRACCVRTYRPS